MLYILPEGLSHDLSKMLPLKAGIANIWLKTVKKTGQIPQIQPFGIKTENRDKFRSRAYVECGVPFTPDPQIYKMFEDGESYAATK